MSKPHDPFSKLQKAQSGHGNIHVANLTRDPKARPMPIVQTLEYQYPLKLVAPRPLSISTQLPTSTAQDDKRAETPTYDLPVFTVFTLSYGGGLVASDIINLTIRLDAHTRLNLLTQGSTKIFKSRPGQPSPASPTSSPNPASSITPPTQQTLTAHLAPHAALVYLPDPVQPFAASNFTQTQQYLLADTTASLCVLDWVTAGRSARGENWDCEAYASRNEVFASDSSQPDGKGRLLLRDNIALSSHAGVGLEGIGIRDRVNGWGVVGTLIVTGSLFTRLRALFMDEFTALPRVGAPRSILLAQSEDEERNGEIGEEEARRRKWREGRWRREGDGGVLWTASRVRDVFIVVKFVAPRVEEGRAWLREMLEWEGSVQETVGDRGLLCLRW